MGLKSALKKTWHFIWNDNSIWSWLVNIVLAFIIIKFVVYPGLGLLLGTSHPIVAVVSGSMEHPEPSFDEWWARECPDGSQEDLYSKYGIDKEAFGKFSYESGLDKGDIVILRSPKSANVGDIIVFSTSGRPEPIIHRAVQVKEAEDDSISFKTKGDNNCGSADFEQSIPEKELIGRALFRIPLLGWIKIGFVELLKLGGLAA